MPSLEKDWRVAAPVAVFTGLLFIPYLGAVGLWDPWESHYAEVAREMIIRHDYVFPHWENAPFFSKPPLLMWLEVVGLGLVGTARATGRAAVFTEWGMRLPVAVFSIVALCLLAVALARTVGKRVAYSAVFALATMPLYFILSRQIITDMPFEAAFICAMACAIVGLFDERTKHRRFWWYGFYVFCGLATLAKELIGVALPAGVLILYAIICVLPRDAKGWGVHWLWLKSGTFRGRVRAGEEPMPVLWAQMKRIHLGTGLLAFAAVALPWLVTMALFAHGRDPENETFLYRYFVHDQLGRLTSGVHSTETNTSFAYFIQEGGYAIFPWVALAPGALFIVARTPPRMDGARHHIIWMSFLWTLLAFTLVSSSATKFPHYVFPALPGMAILMGFFISDLWDARLAGHSGALMLGFILFALVAMDIANGPNPSGRDWAGVPAYTGGLKYFTDLVTYQHDRPYPIGLFSRVLFTLDGTDLTLRKVISTLFEAGGMLVAASVILRSRRGLFASFAAFTVIWATWFSWSHWVDLSHHWTQRDLLWRYYDNARPGEPIAAFQMDWKGETFYSRNTVVQINEASARARGTTPDVMLGKYFDAAGRKWALVEQGARLRLLLQIAERGGHRVRIWDPNLNVKLTIVSVE